MTPFGWQHAKVKSTKSNPPSKAAKSAFMGTLIEQPPQAQKRPNAKYLCAHQIANDQTIVLSPENPQKVHSRPKLWAFEKKFENGNKILHGQDFCHELRTTV